MSPIDRGYRRQKQISNVNGNHPIVPVWMKIVSELREELEKADFLKYVTCFDCFRIGYTGGEDDPVVVYSRNQTRLLIWVALLEGIKPLKEK